MKVKITLLMICSFLLILSFPIFAKKGGSPGGHLQITEVFWIEGNAEAEPPIPDSLVITGVDFDFGDGELVVSLGEVAEDDLEITSETATKIEVAIPTLPAGDYLLSVFRQGGQSQGDDYDLTIGAVGPQGLKGETGPAGEQGEQGISGNLALAGQNCPSGEFLTGFNSAGDIACSGISTEADCSNGTIEEGEICDDGNNDDGDGCSANCLSNETCGNGIIDHIKGEECDDSNNVSGDGCRYDCQIETCLDAYETNDSRGSASYLGSIGDDATYPAGTLTATLSGPSDVDWYKFQVLETVFGSVEPTVDLVNIPSQSDYTLCAYFECITQGSDPTLTCNSGSTTTNDGLLGCCSNNSGSSSEHVSFNVDCDNAIVTPDDNSGWIYVRVSNASDTWSCDNYSLPWGDN